jgi:hypothetical protein
MAMVVEMMTEERAMFRCEGQWYPCLILEKRPTGNYVIWLCARCCSQHYHRRVLVPWAEKSPDLRIVTTPSSS